MFVSAPKAFLFFELHPVLVGLATACALGAAAILVWFLFQRPPFASPTKVALFVGLGVLPIGAAFMGNAANLLHSKHRAFCGSCHVMTPYTEDSSDHESATLAARHARNDLFGDSNCYTCHQDYGMFGTVFTKLGGLRHVYEYYADFSDDSIEEALARIELYEPFTNKACTTCHSTETPGWRRIDDHRSLASEIRSGQTGCASDGCHGPAHPFSKP